MLVSFGEECFVDMERINIEDWLTIVVFYVLLCSILSSAAWGGTICRFLLLNYQIK
jgi:hypothetical protein